MVLVLYAELLAIVLGITVQIEDDKSRRNTRETDNEAGAANKVIQLRSRYGLSRDEGAAEKVRAGKVNQSLAQGIEVPAPIQ